MYNGIGLQTARGSGTNGYVQTNKFFIRPRSTSGAPRPPFPGDEAPGDGGGLGGMRKPNKEILEHDRKRQVELKLLVLRDALEDQGYTEGEVEERVEEARRAAEAEAAAAAVAEDQGGGRPHLPGRGYTDTQSHHVAARKEKQLENLRAALGLNVEDVKKGDAESDVESGELVPGKSDLEFDIAGQKDINASKDGKKNVKKAKKEIGKDKKSYNKSSRKSKPDYSSDSDHGHVSKTMKKKSSRHDSEDDSESDAKEKKHSNKLSHDPDDDTETSFKKEKRAKSHRHDLESDSDSDYGKKKTRHAEKNRVEREKLPVKSSRYDPADEKPRKSRHDLESKSDSDYGKKKTSHAEKNHVEREKLPVKSSRHYHVDEKPRKSRHDSESDSDNDYGKKKTRHAEKIHVEKEKLDVKSSRYDPVYEKPGKNKDISRHDSEDEKPRKGKDFSGRDFEDKKPGNIDISRHDSEDEKPRKSKDSSHHKFEDEKPRKSNYKDSSRHNFDGEKARKSNKESSRLDSESDDFDSDSESDHALKNQKSVRKSRYSDKSDSDHGRSSKYAKVHQNSKMDSRSDGYKNKRPVKRSPSNHEGKKPQSNVLQRGKYTDESETDSDSHVKGKKKLEKSYHHDSKVDKQAVKSKVDNISGKNIDKRKRHDTDSDSDGYAGDRKRKLNVASVKKNVPEKRMVISSSESSDYSSSSSSESDMSSADSYEERKRSRLGEGPRKEVVKQKQKEEEKKELEKQKQREEERKEMEKQKQREEERKEMEKQKEREREEKRRREREEDRRKGGNGVEREYKRKLEDDRYDPNSSIVREDGYRDRQNKDDGKRSEELVRHRTRDLDGYNSKRSRYDDSYYHSRRDSDQRYSRDEYRDRRRH